MCEPTTIAMGVGLALQVGGGLVRMKAQSDEDNFVDRQLAGEGQMLGYAAGDARTRGGIEEGQIRMSGTKAIAEEKAAAGASGVDASSGSVLDLYEDTRLYTELDAQTAKSNAAREAWGFEQQAKGIEEQRRYNRKSAGQRQIASFLSLGGDVLSGATGMYVNSQRGGSSASKGSAGGSARSAAGGAAYGAGRRK